MPVLIIMFGSQPKFIFCFLNLHFKKFFGYNRKDLHLHFCRLYNKTFFKLKSNLFKIIFIIKNIQKLISF